MGRAAPIAGTKLFHTEIVQDIGPAFDPEPAVRLS